MAVSQFLRHWLIHRRGAAQCCRDVAIPQFEPIVTLARLGLVGESRFIEGVVKEIAGSITGKDSPRAVAAVRCRRQPNDEEFRPWVAEARNGLSPVFPVMVHPPFFAGDFAAMLDQPWAESAPNHPLLEDGEVVFWFYQSREQRTKDNGQRTTPFPGPAIPSTGSPRPASRKGAATAPRQTLSGKPAS